MLVFGQLRYVTSGLYRGRMDTFFALVTEKRRLSHIGGCFYALVSVTGFLVIAYWELGLIFSRFYCLGNSSIGPHMNEYYYG